MAGYNQLRANMWLYLFWIGVLSAGNAEILVALVNRLHALPIRHGPLKQIRHLHDLLIPGFPVALLVTPGLTGPALLLKPVPLSDAWDQLPVAVQCWFVVCLCGVAGLVWSTVRFQVRRSPRQERQIESTVDDASRALGSQPVGEGPFRFMTGLPGNQCFEIEISRREFHLSRLPPAFDGLSILHLSDLHFIGTIDRSFFEFACERAQMFEPDVVVFTGDLVDADRFIEWIPDTLGRLSAPLGQYFILGNHDWCLNETALREQMSQTGWQDVAGNVRVLDVGGALLAIGGTERPWMGQHPNWRGVPDEAFRLLLSHTPDNFSWARQERVDLMLTGHNHGGQVVLPVIGPVYSPSLHGVRFAGGSFYGEPTLLFVSRGLSGRHPLRINCRPEVSCLTLRGDD